MKDGRGKALRDARLVVRWNVITYQTKKQYKFSVCILYPVCSLHFEPSLHFVPGLQSAVCILYWPDWYRWLCSSEPEVRTEISELEKKKFSETVCWRAPEDKHNDRTMITLYQLRTNADAWLTKHARLLPFTVHNATSVYGIQFLSTLDNFRPRSTTSVNICFTTVPHSLLSAKLIITLEVCYITTE